MTTYTPPPEPGRTASRRNRPVPLVIGILLALMGLPLLLGGLGLGWAVATQRDDDGFFSTPTEQLSTQTVALSSEVVNLGKAGPNDWWADHHLATVRLSARGEPTIRSTVPGFRGNAAADAVRRAGCRLTLLQPMTDLAQACGCTIAL